MTILRTLLAMLAGLCGLLLAAPIIIAGLPLWLVSLLTRVIGRLLEPSAASWRRIIEFDAIVGWKPKPLLTAYCLAEPAGDVFAIKTDAQGWRGRVSLAESDIVVFGDSFAFGYGVDEERCFSEGTNELRVKAIGAPGYNMVQELLWMQQMSSQLRDKLVVWFIYIGNDLYDNLRPNELHYRRPFVRQVPSQSAWEIVTSHISLERWPYNPDRHIDEYQKMLGNTYSPTFISQRAYAACEFLIAEGKKICTRAGAQLIILTIPDLFELTQQGLERLSTYSPDPPSFDAELPNRNIRDACAKVGVPFVTAKTYLDVSDYSHGDRHWNEKGHRRIHQILSDLHHDYDLRRNNKEQGQKDAQEGEQKRSSSLVATR